MTNLHGFKLIRTESLPDYNGTAYFYEHEVHHCPFIHLKTEDINNHFAISFKTTCDDDSGATHVLEHMVLHGSAKYPVSDVFQELYKRSLANFLNAYTGLDYTIYPFSTTNEKDFHNILDVYLDAAFHPNLNEDNFLTECHRLEPSDQNDPSSPLKHAGVVYSEMCGSLSNPSEYFQEKVRMTMMPDTPYKYVFGGDPDAIAKLTLDQLKTYHKKFYSPTNCYLFHFGCFPVEPIMERMNSFLSNIPHDPVQPHTINLIQPHFTEPRHITVDGPVDAMCEVSEQYKACISWHLCNINDIDLIQDFEVISSLLIESPATLLFQRLIKPQIGSYFNIQGVDDSTPNVMFSIGLDHIEEENVEKFFEIVFDTLKEIVQNGFPESEIQSVIHQYELDVKCLTGNPGNHCHLKFVEYWINGIDPNLIFNDTIRIQRLKQRISSQPRYLESLVQKYLIDNKSCVFLTMKPVSGFTESFNERRNSSINQNISKEERESIIAQAKLVKDLVTKEKPVELLPEISLSDINPIAPKIDFQKDNFITTFPIFTNSVVYITIKADLPLNNKLIADASVFANVLGAIGCGDLDDQEFSVQENLYTGGIIVSPIPYAEKDDSNDITGSFYIKMHFLMHNMKNAINLLKTLLFEPFLDNKEQIHSILNSIEADSTSDLQERGSHYALMKGSAQFSRYYALYELWSGLSFIDRLHDIKDTEECEEIVKNVYEQLFMKSRFNCVIVADKANIEQVKQMMVPIMEDLNKNTEIDAIKDYSVIDKFCESLKCDKVFYEFETMVNTTVSLCKTVPYTSTHSLALGLLSSLLENEFLHVEVREKIGAYGVNASQMPFQGVFTISSYRDTNASDCLEAYKIAIQRAANGEFDEAMIHRAIVNFFSIIDRPMAPNNRVKTYTFSSITYDEIQKRRTAALNMSKEQITEAAKFLLDQHWYSYVFGNRTVSEIPENFTVQSLE
ncbi:Clan ME, family M16, insulinase-like metallopeptidase [Tritrichomonas foetus]|uniref:Clan ME, family M16, insulinase-like metallopeptidase n=1 Tax=Tritrichomonas foetus TaxID=1144522 RepID=A0A1J4J8U6_9EUKA|nr:Clan ME, family M16, insulinase-like metallopeptidase [Tritrichomonas foetus]|eukprot:OHS95610.1 Clan ME, family M16, insulinase-like metallopeptidase [Tritrichomonas foetus]